MSNTWGHYQDNRIQYWLDNYPNDGHLQALASSGVNGMLFGMGAGGVTSYTDARGDGVTNPVAINGNTQFATVADDDGGYLRQVAKQYYLRGPYQVTNTGTPTSTPPAPTATPAVRTPTPVPTATSPVTKVAPQPIYTDGFAPGWADWSWNPVTRNLANTSPVHGGNASIAVTYTGGWSGFQLGRSTALSVRGYDVLRFWVRGASGGGAIKVQMGNSSTQVSQVFTPPANIWTQVELPVTSLMSGGVTYVWWQNNSSSTQPPYYLDDIAFIDK
jgi:hypothetical protein